jgi:cytochrome c-type biogenesis protein CcmE
VTRKQKRLSVIAGAGAFLAVAAALTFFALGQKASYFYMPADLATATLEPGQRIRLGGLVEKGTVVRDQGTQVAFSVTDTEQSVKVTYSGILPDLFREEQGVMAEGSFRRGRRLRGRYVLAKHDESYMPKEVADA